MIRDYLPGLNFIRLYAAFSVLVVHLPKEENSFLRLLTLAANPAVTMFFVLSGYLITYRLLVERERYGNFDLRSFYIRRELRILPLYYLAILIGGILLPALSIVVAPGWQGMLFLLLLMPQVALMGGMWTSMGVLTHLWSIGVEEAFYFFFTFLLHRRIPLVKLALGIIVFWTLGSIALSYIHSPIYSLSRNMRFDCMAIGALAAWMLFTNSRWLKLFYLPVVQLISIVLLMATAVFDLTFPLDDITFSSLCAVLMLNVSSNPKSLLKLEWRGSKIAGNLTYGIYVWHYIILGILVKSFDGLTLTVLVIVITVVVAAVSYRYIEKPILGLKDRIKPRLAPA